MCSFIHSANTHKPLAAASSLGIGDPGRPKFTMGGRLREGFLEDVTSEVKLVG